MKFCKNEKWNNIIKGLLVILVYALFQFGLDTPILKLMVKIFGIAFIYNHPILYSIGMNILISSIQLGLIVLILKDDVIKMVENFKFNKKFAKGLFIGFAIYYGTNIVVNMITSMYNPNLGETTNQLTIEMMLFDSFWSFITTGFMVVVLGPVVEEYVFREGFFKAIPNKYVALVLSSLCFGLIHVLSTKPTFLDGIFYTLPYLASGAVLGYTYIKNDSNISVTIGLHMFMNAVSLTMMLLLKLMPQEINHLIMFVLGSVI